MRLIKQIGITLVLLAHAFSLYANEISQQLSVSVGQVEYILENGAVYDFDQVRNLNEDSWALITQYPINLGNLQFGVWGRFTFKNVEKLELDRILEFANPRIHRLSVYLESSDGEYKDWQLGSAFPYSERELMFRNFALPITLPSKEELIVYFRAESNVGLFLPINIHKEGEFWHIASNQNFAYGLYFGILIMFAVLNISLYLARNDYLFILLAVDLIVFSLMYANHLGLNFEYLWPVDPQFNYLAGLFLGYLVILVANVFTWHFLKLEEALFLKRMYYTFNLLAVAGIILLWLLPSNISSFYCAVLGIGIAIYLSILTFQHRYKNHAYFYIGSYSFAAVATFVYIAHKLALLPTNVLTNYAIGGSILLQTIVLTCALLERNKVRKKVAGFGSQVHVAPDSARDWIAQFSHEVRTPLNGVIGIADLLKETPLNPTQYSYVRTLSSSGKYLLDLVNEELDYENLSRGKVQLNKDVFDLSVVCKQCCQMLEREAEDSQVTVAMELSKEMPLHFYGDEKCLKQIIINLLCNSIKFTHQGKVIIKASYSDEGGLILTIWDDGIGITKQQQVRIFERHRQADSSTYPRYGGSGLGLAICRQLTELMGGKISVASRMGEYCSFTVKLPLELYDSSGAVNEVIEEQSDLAGKGHLNMEMTILGVDDNEINRRVLNAMLKKLGHRMIEATSGQEAIDIVQSGVVIDLILMDCEMPIMNGFEATEVIKKWQFGQAEKACPIIALTAHVLPEHIEKCLAVGMVGHLSKPLHLCKLKELLESLEVQIEH